MQLKERPAVSDLSALARGSDGSPAPDSSFAAGSPAASAVPQPRFAWKTRVLLPGLILLALALLLGYTAQDVLFPPRGVKVVPVVMKAVDGGGAWSGAATMPSTQPSSAQALSSSSTSPSHASQGSASRSSASSSSHASPSMSGGVTVQAPGWVEADPYPIAVTALAGGVVKEVLALEGQSVKAGEVVVRLVDDDAKLALAKAEAELAEKHAALEAAQRQWDNPVERVRAVATGEAMVAQTKAHIEKHHAEVAVEVAKLAQAKEEFDRVQASAASRAVSEIEVIRARQAHEAQKATVEATNSERAIFEADLAQRSAELTAAKDNLRLRIEDAKMLAETKAKAALAQAARDEAALRLSRMEVRAAADGIVMQRLAEPGAKLFLEMDDPRSAQAVRLYDPRRLQVRVDVPLADAAKVGVGMDATVVVGVLPDRTFKGKVSRVVNEADIQKNTLQVKVAITDPSPQLKPEMLARVRFSGMAHLEDAGGRSGSSGDSAQRQAAGGDHSSGGGAGGQMIFAPLSLVHRMGDTAMAWVVDRGRGTASHRTIQLGQTQIDGWVAVASGLSPGDQLIADFAGLRDGQRVRITGEADLSAIAKEEGSASHVSH